MSNQLEAADLPRKAADALTDQPTSTASNTAAAIPPTSINPSQNTATVLRNLFAPYSSRGRARGGYTSNKGRCGNVTVPTTYWTHRFCVIPSTTQENVPNKEEKHFLHKSGLGEKKICFQKNGDPSYFKTKLYEAFPKLEFCGGFDMMRTEIGKRQMLEKMRTPAEGFTTCYLANESNLGQAVCYIRPIQKDLELDEDEEDIDGPEEKCLSCGAMILINCLRDHLVVCQKIHHPRWPPAGDLVSHRTLWEMHTNIFF